MNTRKYIALATFFSVLVVGFSESLAVDSRRVDSQAHIAPAWINSANNFDDPANGFHNTIGPAVRDRSNADALQPTWSDPSLPALDPLRNNLSGNYYDPSGNDSAPSLQKWRLGIYPENTDTGVLINEVVRGSAAERAGLETGDRIVSVHGYQVGYVDGTLYDCGHEFERSADQQGWVRILVQNNRDGKLLNLPLQLDRRNEAITGTVTYRDRSALPRDAVMTVELREILQRGRQPITVARQTYNVGRQVPIPFTLEYDPTQVDSRRHYVLHANISGNGRQLYTLRQDAPVLNPSAPADLQLMLERPSTFGDGNALPNRNDQLEQITRWFRDYLGREPRSQERYVWEAHLARGGSLTDAQLQILSTPEFYYQSNADDAEYVRRMFQLVANRQPSQQEIGQWLQRLQYHNRLRPEMAREFLAMANRQARR
ncbi:MAG: YbaY family lipoprotein [Pirellulales bacterium]|nr:YbaY family lipoprotein [Pirellulales bacterium]